MTPENTKDLMEIVYKLEQQVDELKYTLQHNEENHKKLEIQVGNLNNSFTAYHNRLEKLKNQIETLEEKCKPEEQACPLSDIPSKAIVRVVYIITISIGIAIASSGISSLIRSVAWYTGAHGSTTALQEWASNNKPHTKKTDAKCNENRGKIMHPMPGNPIHKAWMQNTRTYYDTRKHRI